MSFTATAQTSFAQQWAVVEQFCRERGITWSAGVTIITERGPPDAFFNLPVVLAFSLLDEVLGDLAAQGAYSVKSGAMLGAKMSASKQSICWLDYTAVEAAKNRRNMLAHNGELIPKIDCLQIVELIGNELRSMGAIG